jgi:hypothetical protein
MCPTRRQYRPLMLVFLLHGERHGLDVDRRRLAARREEADPRGTQR